MKLWSQRNRTPVDVYYVQSFTPCEPPESPGDHVRVMRLDQPTVAFYRFLYDRVGRHWYWFERLKLNDHELELVISSASVEIDVLYVHGAPAGYVELDAGTPADVEIAYFGLMPEFIGAGYGRYFLRWALHRAWQMRPGRVWLHTCSLDHPHALPNYRKAGLELYRTERVHIADPKIEFPHLGPEVTT